MCAIWRFWREGAFVAAVGTAAAQLAEAWVLAARGFGGFRGSEGNSVRRVAVGAAVTAPAVLLWRSIARCAPAP